MLMNKEFFSANNNNNNKVLVLPVAHKVLLELLAPLDVSVVYLAYLSRVEIGPAATMECLVQDDDIAAFPFKVNEHCYLFQKLTYLGWTRLRKQ